MSVRTSASASNERALADLSREGVVESVNLDAGKAVVRIGEILTPPIDWLCAAGKTRVWCPPSVGEQVSILCPEGDIERAVIVGGLPSSTFAPLFLGGQVGVQLPDGARIVYDPAASVLTLALPGAVTVTAPYGVTVVSDALLEGDLRVAGDIRVDGDVLASGTITGDTDVVAAGVSGKAHKHGQVAAGTAKSGLPE